MYVGARAYLEIGSDARFRAHERLNATGGAWATRDLTAMACGDLGSA